MNNIIYGLSRAMAWFGAVVLTLIALMSVVSIVGRALSGFGLGAGTGRLRAGRGRHRAGGVLLPALVPPEGRACGGGHAVAQVPARRCSAC